MSRFSSGIHLAFTRVAQARAMYSDHPVCPEPGVRFESHGPSATANRVQANVARWYGHMTPYWTTLAPSLRKRQRRPVRRHVAVPARDVGLDAIGRRARSVALESNPWLRAYRMVGIHGPSLRHAGESEMNAG